MNGESGNALASGNNPSLVWIVKGWETLIYGDIHNDLEFTKGNVSSETAPNIKIYTNRWIQEPQVKDESRKTIICQVSLSREEDAPAF